MANPPGDLASRLKVLTHPALPVLDEIGYLPVSQDGAILFLQLINARRRSSEDRCGTQGDLPGKVSN